MDRTKEKIFIMCGMFDTVTLEEISLLKECKKRGDIVIAGIHSDEWMDINRGGYLEPMEKRRELASALKFVNEIFAFDDSDNTVCNLLNLVKGCYPNTIITYLSHEEMKGMPETKIRGINFEKFKQEI